MSNIKAPGPDWSPPTFTPSHRPANMPDCVWKFIESHVGAAGAALFGSWIYGSGDYSGHKETSTWFEALSEEDILGLEQLCRITFFQVANDLENFLQGPDEVPGEFREQYELKLLLAEHEKDLIGFELDTLEIWRMLRQLPFDGVYKKELSKALIRRGILTSLQEPLDADVQAFNEIVDGEDPEFEVVDAW